MATTVTLDPAGTPYVIYGAKDAGTPSLAGRDGLEIPSPNDVLEYAGTAKWIDGDAPVSKRKPNAAIGMRVRLASATEAAHKTALAALRAKVAVFTYETEIDLSGSVSTWTSYAGTVTPIQGTRVVDNTDGSITERFTIVIPVHPVEV